VVTDQNQNVIARYNYEPYGEQKPDNHADGTNRLWQGQREEPDSQLTYMNARYYDPELGQFTAADSIVPDPYQPQTLNPYSFALGDPINRWDPSGNMSMRVEQKKERDQESRSAYARTYNLSCRSETVPCNTYTNADGLVVPLSEYEQDWLRGKYDPVDWEPWPTLSPPPLVDADTDTSQWPGESDAFGADAMLGLLTSGPAIEAVFDDSILPVSEELGTITGNQVAFVPLIILGVAISGDAIATGAAILIGGMGLHFGIKWYAAHADDSSTNAANDDTEKGELPNTLPEEDRKRMEGERDRLKGYLQDMENRYGNNPSDADTKRMEGIKEKIKNLDFHIKGRW
jgi:RHS repeat-associated protein